MHEDPPAPVRTAPGPQPPATSIPPPASASAPPPGPPPGHSATTIERGSFCLARCTCGWSGPARRSRDRARTDAAEHLATP
ncbi:MULTISPECIES: hypothetical protein [Streptomyces]|uniref:hypothetical protein n=1 Tax=Streptomyces TaxID=1883 RepID=UPI0002DA1B95|nr:MULTISPECIES: hypothetical protein [Streptomyces]MCX4485685.1 hypothetical protein [Streptomyces anulatus]MCX4508439.1 hypothetical protein [Streptomyces anulatus]MCX4519354.1 hypothetical protein [Streptomyces anulatus]MCX4602235.1 hypothetical protein [Streptomyces anulatus]WSU74594.1 hypothetical protein OG499_17270 [Streptomyces anulatus]